MTTPTVTEKDNSIETIRGVAIIGIVWLHVIVNVPAEKQGDMHDTLFLSSRMFEYIRLSLFAVISGYLYALRPVTAVNWRSFLSGKMRRLLIPLATALLLRFILIGTGITPYLTLRIMGGEFVYYADGGNYPFELTVSYFFNAIMMHPLPFWFLQALSLILLVIVPLEIKGFLRTPWRLSAVFVLGWITSHLLRGDVDFLSISGAAYLFPYFVFGCAIVRFGTHFLNRYVGAVAVVGLLISVSIFQYDTIHFIDHGESAFPLFLVERFGGVLSVVGGVSAAMIFFWWRPTNRLISRIGSRSYSIFLYHSLTFILSFYLTYSIDSEIAIILIYMSMAIALPMLFERAAQRSRIARRVFFGLS